MEIEATPLNFIIVFVLWGATIVSTVYLAFGLSKLSDWIASKVGKHDKKSNLHRPR